MQPVNVKRTRTIAQARAFLSFRYDENARSGFHSSVTKERYISRNLGPPTIKNTIANPSAAKQPPSQTNPVHLLKG